MHKSGTRLLLCLTFEPYEMCSYYNTRTGESGHTSDQAQLFCRPKDRCYCGMILYIAAIKASAGVEREQVLKGREHVFPVQKLKRLRNHLEQTERHQNACGAQKAGARPKFGFWNSQGTLLHWMPKTTASAPRTAPLPKTAQKLYSCGLEKLQSLWSTPAPKTFVKL